MPLESVHPASVEDGPRLSVRGERDRVDREAETQSLFTREEWSLKNQWFLDDASAIYNVESANLDESSQEPLAEVAVRLTGEDGSSSVRITYFVYEDGEWKHRFSEEEMNLFMPGTPYEEFVEVQQG